MDHRTCNLGSSEDDNNSSSSGFLWPQRNYTCSFCKRQFNSAQALGGHMNVHRRDRAMLIQLPSWVFDCSNPNPNPNNFPSSTSSSSASSANNNKKILSYPYYSSPFTLPQKKSSLDEYPLDQDLAKKKMKKSMRAGVVDVEEFKKNSSFSKKYDRIDVLNKNEVISLELEIGCKDPKEVLDLELRLGCF